jgi:hypothetical protein
MFPRAVVVGASLGTEHDVTLNKDDKDTMQEAMMRATGFTLPRKAVSGRLIGRNEDMGELPADYVKILLRDIAAAGGVLYAVFSYGTPIGWFRARDGAWVVPVVKYSATTSNHQAVVKFLAPAVVSALYKPGTARLGEATPQSAPDQFTDAEIQAEIKYLLGLNGKYGTSPLRVTAYLALGAVLNERKQAQLA